MYNTPRPGWAVFVSNRENIDCGLAIRVYVCLYVYVVYKIYKYLIRIRCFFSFDVSVTNIDTSAATTSVRVCVGVCVCVFVCV